MLLLAPEDKARLQDYCAVSVFVKILMLRGYSFDETTFQHISFQKKVWTVSRLKNQTKNDFNWSIWHVNHYSLWILQVGDASVGWALGYMLALSNLLPAEVPATKKSLSLEVWGILLFILVFLLVAALLFTVIKVCFIKKTGKPVWQRSVDYHEPNAISENLWMVVVKSLFLQNDKKKTKKHCIYYTFDNDQGMNHCTEFM